MKQWIIDLWQSIIDNKSEKEKKILAKFTKDLEDKEKLIKEKDEEILLLHSNLKDSELIITELEARLEDIKKSLKKKTVDINDFKDYYENKKESSSWRYPFLGDGVYRDVKLALRDSTDGEKKLRGAARGLIEEFALNSDDKPELVIESVIKYFRKKNNWSYKKDEENSAQGKKRDFWQKAEVSWESRVGDCEDLSILMHNLIYYIFDILGLGKHYWRLEFSAWVLISNEGGHAQNTWLGEDGEWYVIESTYDLTGSFSRTWLKTPIRYNNLYKKPLGWARKDRSWRGSISSLENMVQVS